MLLEFFDLGVGHRDAFAVEHLLEGGIGLPIAAGLRRHGVILRQRGVKGCLCDG